MPVWSGEALRRRLPALIDPFDEAAIDCAAYTLKAGGEIYVSPSELKDRTASTIRQLLPSEDSTIPPGQFAFLITAETVRVPNDAIALISIKARIKWRGLVNVSGFHVDPGYQGRLIFAVFNAGPSTIHVKSGEDCFLIWYLSLDQVSESVRTAPGHTQIGADLVAPISGEWKSIEMLDSRMRKIEKTQASIDTSLKVLLALAGAIVAALVIYLLKNDIEVRTTSTRSAAPGATVSAPHVRRVPTPNR